MTFRKYARVLIQWFRSFLKRKRNILLSETTNKILIAVAIGVLLFTSVFLVKRVIALNAIRDKTVLVTNGEIPKWSRIQPEKITWVYYQTKPLPVGAITKSNLPRVLDGAFIAADTLPANQPIMRDMLFEVGKDSDYSRLLSKNKVALKIDMEYSMGSISVLQPGIRIDILLTEKRLEKNNVNYVTRMIARKVLVLDVISQGSNSSFGFGGGRGKAVSLLIEVDKDDAKKMPVYQNSGELSFVIDSKSDGNDTGSFDGKAYSTQDLDKKVEVIYGK